MSGLEGLPEAEVERRCGGGGECSEFIDTGRCGHTDAEHDAMADGRALDGDECERCKGTGDRYGRGPGNFTPNTPETTCPDCYGTGRQVLTLSPTQEPTP